MEGLCLNWTPLQELKKEIIRKWPCRKTKKEGTPARLSTWTETLFLDIVVKIFLLTSLTACLLLFFSCSVLDSESVLFIKVLFVEGSIISNTKDIQSWRSLLAMMSTDSMWANEKGWQVKLFKILHLLLVLTVSWWEMSDGCPTKLLTQPLCACLRSVQSAGQQCSSRLLTAFRPSGHQTLWRCHGNVRNLKSHTPKF